MNNLIKKTTFIFIIIIILFSRMAFPSSSLSIASDNTETQNVEVQNNKKFSDKYYEKDLADPIATQVESVDHWYYQGHKTYAYVMYIVNYNHYTSYYVTPYLDVIYKQKGISENQNLVIDIGYSNGETYQKLDGRHNNEPHYENNAWTNFTASFNSSFDFDSHELVKVRMRFELFTKNDSKYELRDVFYDDLEGRMSIRHYDNDPSREDYYEIYAKDKAVTNTPPSFSQRSVNTNLYGPTYALISKEDDLFMDPIFGYLRFFYYHDKRLHVGLYGENYDVQYESEKGYYLFSFNDPKWDFSKPDSKLYFGYSPSSRIIRHLSGGYTVEFNSDHFVSLSTDNQFPGYASASLNRYTSDEIYIDWNIVSYNYMFPGDFVVYNPRLEFEYINYKGEKETKQSPPDGDSSYVYRSNEQGVRFSELIFDDTKYNNLYLVVDLPPALGSSLGEIINYRIKIDGGDYIHTEQLWTLMTYDLGNETEFIYDVKIDPTKGKPTKFQFSMFTDKVLYSTHNFDQQIIFKVYTPENNIFDYKQQMWFENGDYYEKPIRIKT